MKISANLVVVGGGAAGVAAAVSAARLGQNVILIERNKYLGGKATAAEVGTICGLYLHNRAVEPKWNVSGFTREFAQKIEKLSGIKAYTNSEGLHFLPYNIQDFKNLCHQLMEINSVQVYFNATVTKVKVEEDLLNELHFQTDGGNIELTCDAVVDCSGGSLLSGNSTFKAITSSSYQAAAQVFTLKGIPALPESTLNFSLLRDLARGIKNGQLSDDFDRTYVVPASIKNGKITLKMAIPLQVDNNPGNMKDLRNLALNRVVKLVRFLNDHSEVFKDVSIDQIADEVGTRTGERMLGKYILTGEDVMSCKKFENAVAFGNWPIEKWSLSRLVQTDYFEENNWYEIPSDCLQSSQVKNLFAAGRSISADEDAIASARVMGTCLQTGFAAGVMAAFFITGKSAQEAVRFIQNQQIFK